MGVIKSHDEAEIEAEAEEEEDKEDEEDEEDEEDSDEEDSAASFLIFASPWPSASLADALEEDEAEAAAVASSAFRFF
jgi:hypothetical protein